MGAFTHLWSFTTQAIDLDEEARTNRAVGPSRFTSLVGDRYLTACANDFCREAKRQTISAQDVMQAIKELEFGELEEPLREYLDQVKASRRAATKSIFYLGTWASHASAFPPPDRATLVRLAVLSKLDDCNVTSLS